MRIRASDLVTSFSLGARTTDNRDRMTRERNVEVERLIGKGDDDDLFV